MEHEEDNLVESLKEYIYWFGFRDEKSNLIPIKEQPHLVSESMILLKNLEKNIDERNN